MIIQAKSTEQTWDELWDSVITELSHQIRNQPKRQTMTNQAEEAPAAEETPAADTSENAE